MLAFLGFSPIGSSMARAVAESSGSPISAGFGGAVALAAGSFWLRRAPYIREIE